MADFQFKSVDEVKKSGITFGANWVVAFPDDPIEAASDEWLARADDIAEAVAGAISKPTTLEIIRDNEPDVARKITELAEARALADAMGIETRGKNELTLITEIKAAL